MREHSLAFRLLSLCYVTLATTSVAWLLLQGQWTAASWGLASVLLLYLGLSVVAAYYVIDPPGKRFREINDFRISLKTQKLVHCLVVLMPVPFISFFSLYWLSYATLSSSSVSRSSVAFCVALADLVLGESCSEELMVQFSNRACMKAEQAELISSFKEAEMFYRLQADYQWLAGRDTGPLAQTGLVAVGAMCDRQSREHEADLIYTVAEGLTGCRYADRKRGLSVIYGCHLLKLLKEVPDEKLPVSWYLTPTALELRRVTAAKAALICCPFDFIIEHDCSRKIFSPRYSALKEAEDLWTAAHASSHARGFSQHNFIGSDVGLLQTTQSRGRQFSTRALRRYLSQIDPKVAAENLGFYKEFNRNSTVDIDEKLLPAKRTCSVGFPFAARQLVSHHVWKISERDYVGLMLLIHDSPSPQYMCVDQMNSKVLTY